VKIEVFQLAIENVISLGDTDIFPFPIENHAFHDLRDETVALLQEIDGSFDTFLAASPPTHLNALSPVSYTGFRWSTQMDPIWNLYVLAMVIALGEDIEKARLPVDDQIVFSYRFGPDGETGQIFRADVGWREFQKRSLELCDSFPFVLICDISEFYSRIYHHRLENALPQATRQDLPSRLMTFLQNFSNNNSYGLPVGGPAARLLAELVLNRTDRLFVTNGVTFCRFADDYHVFARDVGDAYAKLILVSEKLLSNEGLSLQKAKTRIITAAEFRAGSDVAQAPADDETDLLRKEARSFITFSLRFDPYSPNAVEEYERLKHEVSQFDIVGLLGRELKKTRVHTALTKKLLAAIKYLSESAQNEIVLSLLDNLDALAPLLPNVMTVIRSLFPELRADTQTTIISNIQGLVRTASPLAQVDLNLAYMLRVLGCSPSPETEELFVSTYNKNANPLVRRDIILLMAKIRGSYWISDIKQRFALLSAWEKRAFIVASYCLGDEGKHWRMHEARTFTPFECLVRDWASKRVQSGTWTILV